MLDEQDDAGADDQERWPGYHDCACCDEIICGGLLSEKRCDSCVEAGCEIHDHDEEDDCDCEYDGLNKDGCQIPTCPSCETPMSFMNDRKWHDNCDADECERKRKEEVQDAP